VSSGDGAFRWAAAILDALAGSGITDIIVAPGSRSTPFVLAAAASTRFRLHDVLDERSAGFFALGMARATGRPPLVLCTSGTAPAHVYPAVIEAGLTYLPLVVLSADRPFDLAHAAAPQTIDQTKLFGDHARLFVELGLPDADGAAALRRLCACAVAAALGPTPGAVHLNARARKPLEPGRLPPAGIEAAPPPPRIHAARLTPDPAAVAEIAALLAGVRRGLIIAGPAPAGQADPSARAAAWALVAATGFPLLAEAASQLRFAGGPTPPDPALLADLALEPPELVVQLGAPPTTAAWDRLAAPRIVIAPHGCPDPSGAALHVLGSELPAACVALAQAMVRPAGDPAWAARVAAAADRRRRAVAAELDGTGLTEGHVARAVVASLPPGAQLAIGNSLPIRAIDTFAPERAADVVVLHQRGANGIDGLVSGAAGAAVATGRPTTLLLGDVSLLHDVGGLHTVRHVRGPFTIVCVNNDGGRIFEQLPVAAVPGVGAALEHFTTPHGLGFAPAAALFGLRHVLADSPSALAAALARAETPTLIEARVPPSDAAAQARRLAARQTEMS